MKRIILHPKVHSDIDAVMDYYEGVASRALADDFYIELRQFIVDAAKRPESYAVRARDIRRVNLHRFPYHFLFRIVGDDIRVLVVRHHRRHPSIGLRRR
jgi:plasmid stabilization system protein ParE